jgi:uncharacterized protein
MERVPPSQTSPSVPAPAVEPPRDSDDPPWRLWMAPAALVLGFGIAQVVTIVLEIVAHAGGASLTSPPASVNIIANFLFDLSFVAAAVYFARLHGTVTLADFGFRRPSWKLGVGALALAGISYYVLSAVYQAIVHVHGSDKLPSNLGVSTSTAAAIAVTVFVCVIAPICEEFFFRGFFFGVLRRWRIMVGGYNIGTWVAAVLTGIVFGLAHAGSAPAGYLVPLGFLGFVLCLVRWRTRSLYPGMALHSINNALAMGITEFHWGVGLILALIAGSGLLIATITWPLSAAQ